MPDSCYDKHAWHRADYILRGDYCPLEEVRSHLEHIRSALRARFLIHVAHDHELIMRSLSWALGKDWDADSISLWIRQADYRQDNSHINRTLLDAVEPAPMEPVAYLDEKAASQLAGTLLRAEHPKLSRPIVDPPEVPDLRWSGLLLNHTGRAGLKPWDGEVRSLLLIHSPLDANSCPTDPNRQLQDLGVMLKCTVEANARRDAVVMNKVAHELRTIDFDSEFAFEKMAEQALRLACDVTGSSGGAIYLSTTSSDRLRFRRIAASEGSTFRYPSEIPFEKGNTLTWVVDQHRAYQQIGSSLTTRGLVRAVDASGGIELVTPIAGPLGNTWAPAVGAIALFHESGDPRDFSSYERALVRNVCLRVALARTNVATREIAHAISTLRSTSPRRLRIENGQEHEVPSPGWPKDIGLAVTRFEQPLAHVADSTQSHSVTLRIGLPQHHNPDVYGFGLVRVAAYPKERMGDPYKVLHEGDPGLHWEVMRSGEPRCVSRIGEGDPHFPEIREGTKSALCVPIRVEGILAGTLNMESPFEDNYAPFLPLVLALSGAVGRTLADARAQLEDDILDWAARALDRRHDSSRELVRISAGLKNLPPSSQRDTLLHHAERMNGLVRDMRQTSERRPTPASLWELFEATVNRLRLSIHGCKQPRLKLFRETLDERACSHLVTMFESVLYNLNRHSSGDARDTTGRDVPRVRFAVLKLQAVDQAVIILESLSSKYLDKKTCAELYRYPIKSPNAELRLGTYIAGINARRVGARIHASLLHDDRTLRTTMIIPIEPLRAKKG